MLASRKVIGFIPTTNFKRARVFFERTLGLEFVGSDGFALVFKAGGTTIRVVKVQDLTPAQYTILGFKVPNIETIVSRLASRSVTFERYPGMKQGDLGIWSAPGGAMVAWFKDPDGNTLSVTQY